MQLKRFVLARCSIEKFSDGELYAEIDISFYSSTNHPGCCISL